MMRYFPDWWTTLFSARRRGVTRQNKFLLMWRREKELGFPSRMWQLYFLFLCKILYAAVPSSLSIKAAEINTVSGHIFLSHPERDVRPRRRKLVWASIAFKRCFSISGRWFSMRHSSSCKGLCFFISLLRGTTPGQEQPNMWAHYHESQNKKHDLISTS